MSFGLCHDFPPATQHISDAIGKEIGSCLESVQTIMACSLHQKNIIDDVLTLSKLDSNMISICPSRLQPVEVVKDTIRIFDMECLKLGIGLRFVEDESLLQLGASWLMFDPLRFNQVSATPCMHAMSILTLSGLDQSTLQCSKFPGQA